MTLELHILLILAASVATIIAFAESLYKGSAFYAKVAGFFLVIALTASLSAYSIHKNNKEMTAQQAREKAEQNVRIKSDLQYSEAIATIDEAVKGGKFMCKISYDIAPDVLARLRADGYTLVPDSSGDHGKMTNYYKVTW